MLPSTYHKEVSYYVEIFEVDGDSDFRDYFILHFTIVIANDPIVNLLEKTRRKDKAKRIKQIDRDDSSQ